MLKPTLPVCHRYAVYSVPPSFFFYCLLLYYRCSCILSPSFAFSLPLLIALSLSVNISGRCVWTISESSTSTPVVRISLSPCKKVSFQMTSFAEYPMKQSPLSTAPAQRIMTPTISQYDLAQKTYPRRDSERPRRHARCPCADAWYFRGKPYFALRHSLDGVRR